MAIEELLKDGQKKDFSFYSNTIKPELKHANPSLYDVILSSDTKLEARTYGVTNR